MKKKILLFVIVSIIAAINVEISIRATESNKSIMLTLASLATDWWSDEWGGVHYGEGSEIDDDKSWTQPETIRCKLDLGGGWFTSSVERICVFCATPNTCTPVNCGESF